MRYLLDVNALVAFGLLHHEFHDRVTRWVSEEAKSSEMLTCSITELGFVRILSQASAYGFAVVEAKKQLLRLKKEVPLTLLVDNHDIANLPTWVRLSPQTTDGHLARLAEAHGAALATFDKAIKGAFLIP
jgi:predicted nucleic acid-binding protein